MPVREGMRLYREQLQAHGHTWQPQQAALMVPIHVAATSAAARHAMRPGVEKFYRNLLEIFSHLPAKYMDNTARLRDLHERVVHLPYEQFCAENAVFGDPQECIDRLQVLREDCELSQIICWFDQGCMLPLDEVKRAMDHCAERVLPRV